MKYEWISMVMVSLNGRQKKMELLRLFTIQPGHTANLRVTDNDAKTDTDSLTVTVKSPDEEEEGIPGFGFCCNIG